MRTSAGLDSPLSLRSSKYVAMLGRNVALKESRKRVKG
jgi:hypothetical protein